MPLSLVVTNGSNKRAATCGSRPGPLSTIMISSPEAVTPPETTIIGAAVPAEEPILIVESMKMEIPVQSEKAGTLAELLVGEGDAVAEGQVVAILEI